jgi:PPOX class probable F420-dependent enzyme
MARTVQLNSLVPTLQDFVDIGRQDQFLAVVSTLRFDATIQATVVNAGVLGHPVHGSDVVGFVTYGRTKLANLRNRPQLSLTFRAGWKWVTVEGRAELIGPDDPHSDLSPQELPLLLRQIFRSAGGAHDDWDAYDRTMVAQRRTGVLVSPTRIYGN